MNTKKIRVLFLVLSVSLFLATAGCDSEVNPVKEMGDGMIESMETSKEFADEITFLNIKKALQMYYAENSKYPESLKDIEDFMDSPIDIELYEYNPETGELNKKSE